MDSDFSVSATQPILSEISQKGSVVLSSEVFFTLLEQAQGVVVENDADPAPLELGALLKSGTEEVRGRVSRSIYEECLIVLMILDYKPAQLLQLAFERLLTDPAIQSRRASFVRRKARQLGATEAAVEACLLTAALEEKKKANRFKKKKVSDPEASESGSLSDEA